MTFNEWWLKLKPAECDEVKDVFVECWRLAQAAEREACASMVEDWDIPDCGGWSLGGLADALRERSNAEITAR